VVEAAERIRVLLAEMPPMLRDIVKQTVERAPDMIVVGEIGSGGLLAGTLERTEADVVIVGTSEPSDFDGARRLLIAAPQARVLMLAMGGRSAVMYELQPHQTRLGEVSPQALIDAIRGGTVRLAWQRPL
jgi:DNA-binding NarL/FixJ family response regulator